MRTQWRSWLAEVCQDRANMHSLIRRKATGPILSIGYLEKLWILEIYLYPTQSDINRRRPNLRAFDPFRPFLRLLLPLTDGSRR